LIVHQTQRTPATQPMAQWLSRLLDPVVQAVKLTAPPPIEIRPTGRWGGWYETDPRYSPDYRISISSQIVFWSAEGIRYMFVHEACHHLLNRHKVQVQSHSAEFFCLNAALLLRSAAFFDASPLLKLSLYELQDEPEALADQPEAHTIAMAWALGEAPKLAATDLTAEELAGEVVKRWKGYIKQREAAEKAAHRAELDRQKREAAMANTIENLRFWVVGLPILAGVTTWLWLWR
jgi:Protein of unknown function DUF45